MTKDEIIKSLHSMRLDRSWLAAESGYTEDTVMNKLAPKGNISKRMLETFSRVINTKMDDNLSKLMPIAPNLSSDNVWDAVRFSAYEVVQIAHGLQAGGYNHLEDLYHDAVIHYADKLLEDNVDFHSDALFPYYGPMAAGQPVESQLEGETFKAASKLDPSTHAIFEVCGQSGEPQFMDGEKWIVELSMQSYTAKKGKPAVFKDSNGCYLKIYNGKQAPFSSVNPNFPDVTPGDSLSLVGYPVERIQS